MSETVMHRSTSIRIPRHCSISVLKKASVSCLLNVGSSASYCFVFILMCQVLFLSPVIAGDTLPDYSVKYDPARNPFADGYAAIQLATQTQRRILIEIGGDWCAWCHRLDRFLATHENVKKHLYQTFVILKVNVSEENNNKKFLDAFPKIQGYPHMFVAESDGTVLYSKDTAEFLVNGQYSVDKFEIFFKRWRKSGT